MGWEKLKTKLLREVSDEEIAKLAKDKGIPFDTVKLAYESGREVLQKLIDNGQRYHNKFIQDLNEDFKVNSTLSVPFEDIDVISDWTAFHLGMLTQSIDSMHELIDSQKNQIDALEVELLTLKVRLDAPDLAIVHKKDKSEDLN